MKQTIRTIALFMALTVAASGCQKEAIPETIGNLTVSENVRTA